MSGEEKIILKLNLKKNSNSNKSCHSICRAYPLPHPRWNVFIKLLMYLRVFPDNSNSICVCVCAWFNLANMRVYVFTCVFLLCVWLYICWWYWCCYCWCSIVVEDYDVVADVEFVLLLKLLELSSDLGISLDTDLICIVLLYKTRVYLKCVYFAFWSPSWVTNIHNHNVNNHFPIISSSSGSTLQQKSMTSFNAVSSPPSWSPSMFVWIPHTAESENKKE